MPHPLIGNRSKIEPIIIENEIKSTSSLKSDEIPYILNRKRSKKYIDTLTSLDTAGIVSKKKEIEDIIEAIKQELPEIAMDHFPKGIVARCYLGEPFEVHTLDLFGTIIEHYKTYESLPDNLEKARSLSLHPKYAFVEVYQNGELRAISKDGSVIFLRC